MGLWMHFFMAMKIKSVPGFSRDQRYARSGILSVMHILYRLQSIGKLEDILFYQKGYK